MGFKIIPPVPGRSVAAAVGFVFIQQSAAAASVAASPTVTPTLPGAASAGSTVIMYISSSSPGKAMASAAGLGGTWVQLSIADNNNFDDDIAEIWMATNISGGGTSVVGTFVGDVTQASATLVEFSHSGAATLHAAGVAAFTNDAAPTTNTVATSALDLVVAMFEQRGTQTVSTGPANGFTAASSVTNAAGCVHAPAWKIGSLANPQGTSWTTSAGNHWAATSASLT